MTALAALPLELWLLAGVLGLALVRQQRKAEALTELSAAARLAPSMARYAYVHAVATHDMGRAAEAIGILRSAESRHPFDRPILQALAEYSAEIGRDREALAYAKRLLAIDPNDESARELAGRFSPKEGP